MARLAAERQPAVHQRREHVGGACATVSLMGRSPRASGLESGSPSSALSIATNSFVGARYLDRQPVANAHALRLAKARHIERPETQPIRRP